MPRHTRSKIDYTKPDRNQGYRFLETLKKQYDPKRGGYLVPSSARGRAPTFVKSKYKPEEGGYFVDSMEKARNAMYGPRGRQTKLQFDNSGFAIGGYAEAFNRPRWQVDSIKTYLNSVSDAKPGIRPAGTSTAPRRGKQLNFQSSTLLTKAKKLGADAEDDTRLSRKTLLGG